MSIFKKAEEKKLLTVLEAYQQAFGGVPDDAECYVELEEDDFYGQRTPFANIVTDEGHFFWDYDEWVPVKELGMTDAGGAWERPRFKPPFHEATDYRAYRLQGKIKRAPQLDKLLEEMNKGYSNKSNYLKLIDGEDY